MILITKANLVWVNDLKTKHFVVLELARDFEKAKTQLFEREYDTSLVFVDAGETFGQHHRHIMLRFGLIHLHVIYKIYFGQLESRRDYFTDHRLAGKSSDIAEALKNYKTNYGPFRMYSFNQMKLMNDIVRKIAVNDVIQNKNTPFLFGSEIESIPSTYGIDVVHISKPTFRNAILADVIYQEDYTDFHLRYNETDPYSIIPKKVISKGPYDGFIYASTLRRESISMAHAAIAQIFNSQLIDITNSQRKLLYLFLAQMVPNSTHLYIGAYPGTATIAFIKLLPNMDIDFYFYDPMFKKTETFDYGNRLHIISEMFAADDAARFVTKSPAHPNFVFTSDIRMDALDTMEENDEHTFNNYILQLDIVKGLHLALINRCMTTIFYSSIKGLLPDAYYNRIVGSVEVLQPSYRIDDEGALRANETRIFYNTIISETSEPISYAEGQSREEFLQQYKTTIPEQHIIQDFLSAAKVIYEDYLHFDFDIDFPHEFIILNTITDTQNAYSDVVAFMNTNKEKINTINFYGRDVFAPAEYTYHGFTDHTIDPADIIDFLEHNCYYPALNHLQMSPLFGLPVQGLCSSKLYTICKGFDRLSNFSICVQDLVTSPAQGNFSLKLKSNMLLPEFNQVYQEEKLKSVDKYGRRHLYAEDSSRHMLGTLPSEYFDPSGHLALLLFGRNNPHIFYTLKTYHVNVAMNILKSARPVAKKRRTKPKERFIKPQEYRRRGAFTNVELENVVWHGSDEVRAGLWNGYYVRKRLTLSGDRDFELTTRAVEFFNSQVVQDYDGFKVYGLRGSTL